MGVYVYKYNNEKEGFYSDYQRMSSLPFITPPQSNILSLATNAAGKSNGGRFLGGAEINADMIQYPDQPLPRFGPYYDELAMIPKNQGIAIYETGTAYNPNVYSEFGVITPDDI